MTAANRTRRFRLWRDERGGVAPLIALGMVAVGGFSGLAIDGAYLYAMRTRLQATADAAALAGARDLPNAANANAAVAATATANMAAAQHGTVIKTSDVAVGNWNSGTRVFTAGGAPTNAVRVTAKRATANANPVPTAFAVLFGVNQVDVVVDAIATGGSIDSCELNGIIAGREVLSGSNNIYQDAVCMYGRQGVKVGSDNTLSAGSRVGMLNLATLQAGGNNNGLSAALFQGDMQPTLAQQSATIIDDLQNLGKGMPSYITQTLTVSSLPSNPVSGTAYFVTGVATIQSNKTIDRVVIIANQEVNVGSDVNLKDVVLASRTRVQTGSNIAMGRNDYCATGNGTVQLLSTENVLLGSNVSMKGVQIIAGLDVDMGSNNAASLTGVTVQATRDVKFGSNDMWSGCASNNQQHRRFGAGPKLRLVN